MWPDVDFSFPNAVLICDHVRHSTTVVANAIVDEGDDPKAVFAEAITRRNEIVSVLLGPEPANDPATERLIATAPSQRSHVDIRALAKQRSNFSRSCCA